MTKTGQLIRLSLVNRDGASSIRARVGNRVYPAQIASITNVTYPCISYELNLKVFGSLTDCWDGTMRVWCWSNKNLPNPSEAWELFDDLRDYWHQTSFDDSTLGRVVQLIQSGNAIPLYDDEIRVHGVMSDWNIYGGII